MKSWRNVVVGLLAIVLLVGLAACTTDKPAEETPEDDGEVLETTETASYIEDIGDGKVRVAGVLTYTNLEGGTWAIVDDTVDPAENLAVVSNFADMESKLKALEGKSVIAEGELSQGASIRMAGPEMTVSSIEEAAK